MDKISSILKNAGLKTTTIRREMLEIFLNSDIALTHADICCKLEGEFDKVTVYRNIHTFIEKGVIHQVPGDSRSAKYACADTGIKHEDSHAHFICEECGNTYCLELKGGKGFDLPDSFTIHNLSVVAEGVCSVCSKKTLH